MKRRLPVALMGFGILLLVGSAWLFLMGQASGASPDSLPDRIAGLPRTIKTTGSEAVSQVGDLHGRQFPITSAEIGTYGNSQITLWVAGAESSTTATDMVTAMQARIANGNSPFTPLEQRQERGRVINVLEGTGQKHYYFQSNNLVIWLAADPELADQSIQQVLEVYP